MWPQVRHGLLVALVAAGILIGVGLVLAGLLTPRDGAFLVLVYTAVTSCVIGLQMKRKIRKDLGRKATDLDLTSIDTWMKVEDVEEGKRGDPNVKSPLSDTEL